MVAALSTLYRVIFILCLLQIVSGIWTMHSFGFEETGQSSSSSSMQFHESPFWSRGIAAHVDDFRTIYWRGDVSPVCFHSSLPPQGLLLIHFASAQSTRRTNHRFSRIDKHIQMLTTLLMAGFLILLTATIFLFTRGHEVLAPCVADMFTGSTCGPIIVDLALPVIILVILLSAVNRISSRARAIHGDARIELPPPPPPPPTLVPAWSLGNVAETEEGDRGGIRLSNPL
ncbi:hypothetical protein B0H19DRAFT_1193340 [Mycena capillaripes]|nr:hypothetical protein B0H19DRAFT_1193340 [Mycena capillaripes]